MDTTAMLQDLNDRIAKLTAVRDALLALDETGGGVRQPVARSRPSKAGRGGEATGTKALILDVLSDGEPQAMAAIAKACKVAESSCGYHLRPLVESGDVVKQGAGRSTMYRIP